MVDDVDSTSLWSRQGKDLTKYVPELVTAAVEMSLFPVP